MTWPTSTADIDGIVLGAWVEKPGETFWANVSAHNAGNRTYVLGPYCSGGTVWGSTMTGRDIEASRDDQSPYGCEVAYGGASFSPGAWMTWTTSIDEHIWNGPASHVTPGNSTWTFQFQFESQDAVGASHQAEKTLAFAMAFLA